MTESVPRGDFLQVFRNGGSSAWKGLGVGVFRRCRPGIIYECFFSN